MKYIIHKVKNVFDQRRGYKVELNYNNNKTKYFGINIEEKGFKTSCANNGKKANYIVTGIEDCLSTEMDNNYDTAFETKKLLDHSINFVKDKIKKLTLSGEHDYVIYSQYIFLDSLKNILGIITKELSLVERQFVTAPVH